MTVKDILMGAKGLIPDALMVGGAAAVSYGASIIYLPAGWIVGGVLAIAGGALAARGA